MIDQDMKLEAARTALKKMYQGGSFNICTIDACKEMLGVSAPKQEYNFLRTLHCVNFSDMSKELRYATIRAILTIFTDRNLGTATEILDMIGHTICLAKPS